MQTELLRAGRGQDVARAAALLRDGAIVAFPTETVYGLGVRADDAAAVAELRRIKRRPPDRKFSLLIASASEAERLAAPGPAARALAAAFWPGPLTLVVPDGRGGDVGLRCPDCAAALELLRRVGAPLAAPSANLSGCPPATTAAEVMAAFAGEIAAVLDGGPVRLGTASTVARLTGDRPEVLREGAVSEADLRAALQKAGEA